MDYVIGFLIGYYIRIFFNYLKKLADFKVVEDHEWDWFYSDDTE